MSQEVALRLAAFWQHANRKPTPEDLHGPGLLHKTLPSLEEITATHGSWEAALQQAEPLVGHLSNPQRILLKGGTETLTTILFNDLRDTLLQEFREMLAEELPRQDLVNRLNEKAKIHYQNLLTEITQAELFQLWFWEALCRFIPMFQPSGEDVSKLQRRIEGLQTQVKGLLRALEKDEDRGETIQEMQALLADRTRIVSEMLQENPEVDAVKPKSKRFLRQVTAELVKKQREDSLEVYRERDNLQRRNTYLTRYLQALLLENEKRSQLTVQDNVVRLPQDVLLGHFVRRVTDPERFPELQHVQLDVLALNDEAKQAPIWGYTRKRTPIRKLMIHGVPVYALMKFSDSGEETLTTAYSQKMVEQRNFEV